MADLSTPPQPPALRRFFRLGLVCHFALVALIDAGAYAGVIPTQIKALPHYDLVMHFLLVGTVGFFVDGALSHRRLFPIPYFPRLGPSIVLLLAGTEEYLQRFSPRRSSTWSDFLANASGILVCAYLARRLTIAKAAQHAASAGAGGGAP